MKCSDCDNLGWVSDEGEQVWGWCWYRRSCPDPDIDRDCPNFALKRPPMLQQLKAENENLRAEMKRMEACIYYKAGGFCRYGGDEPANVCVLGPCAHEVAAQKFIAEAAAEKGERDHPTPPEPLTLEQLREMVGHWVWVLVNYEHNGEAFQCDGWALVATPCRIAYLDQEFPVSELGTRFQAYTQPVSNFRVRFMRNREGMAVDEESE